MGGGGGVSVSTVRAACQASASAGVTAVTNCSLSTPSFFGQSRAAQRKAPRRLLHRREVVPIDNQPVVRPNRDTLYSTGVFDLDAGPVTVTLPEAGGRFMSMQGINEDHYVVGSVRYGAARHTFDKNTVGTRYMLIGMRTLVDPKDPNDVQQAGRARKPRPGFAHACQQ